MPVLPWASGWLLDFLTYAVLNNVATFQLVQGFTGHLYEFGRCQYSTVLFNYLIRIRKMHQANDRNRFVWSLNPIFVWFRSIGIELDYSKVRSSPRHILMSMFAIGLFVLNLVISVMVIHEKINIENRKSRRTIRKIVIILSQFFLFVLQFFLLSLIFLSKLLSITIGSNYSKPCKKSSGILNRTCSKHAGK